MDKKRPFYPTTFAHSEHTETGNPMPKFSKDILLSIAQNAEELAVLMSNNLVSTMGLSPLAIPTLHGAILRMLKDDLRPRFEEISVEDATHLYGEDWAPTPEELLRQVEGKPGSKAYWFLTVGMDAYGSVAFQVWPIAIVHPTLSSHPSIEEIRNSIEISVLERFAVMLSTPRHPEARSKL